MKKFYIILIALFLVNGAMAQWFFLNPYDSAFCRAVYFTDANTGYVSGNSDFIGISGDTIWRTTDGGMNWTPQYYSPSNIVALFFPDVNTGYAIQSTYDGWGQTYGVVLKTTNGGSDWVLTSLGPELGLGSIFFTDANTGYAAGGNVILKTTDGGINWITQLNDPSASIVSIFFIDANTGYAVGGIFSNPMQRTILKTTNGGLNWNFILNEQGGALQTVYFTTTDTGYVGGAFDLLKTTDGGINWIDKSYGNGSEIYNSICFKDSNVGYAVGSNFFGSFIIKTTDGGTNWFVQSIIEPNEQFLPNSVFFPVADTGYIASDHGILKTENGGGLPVGIGEQKKNSFNLSIYPIPTSTTITIELPTTPNKNSFMTIIDITGKQVLKRELTHEQTVVDVSGLPQGVYFVRVVDERAVMVGKFVKQ